MNATPISYAELEDSFNNILLPLFEGGFGLSIYATKFESYYSGSVSTKGKTYLSNASIYVRMDANMQDECKAAFRAYLRPHLAQGEKMICWFNCFNQRISLDLGFKNERDNAFANSPWVNENIRRAIEVLMNKAEKYG